MEKLTSKELREKGRKQCWSPSQRLWMELSLYLTVPLARTAITPNMITACWIFIELFSSYLFMRGEYWTNVIAVILFNFVALLGDHMDGNLARMKGKKTIMGPYLEQLGLLFGTPLVFLGLAVGNQVRYGNAILYGMPLLAITLAGVLCWLLEKAIRINPLWFDGKHSESIRAIYGSASLSAQRRSRFGAVLELFRRGQPFNLFFFGVVFDYTLEIAAVYSLFFAAEFLRKLGTMLLALRKADKEMEQI